MNRYHVKSQKNHTQKNAIDFNVQAANQTCIRLGKWKTKGYHRLQETIRQPTHENVEFSYMMALLLLGEKSRNHSNFEELTESQ